jgi:hypothetical protein
MKTFPSSTLLFTIETFSPAKFIFKYSSKGITIKTKDLIAFESFSFPEPFELKLKLKDFRSK